MDLLNFRLIRAPRATVNDPAKIAIVTGPALPSRPSGNLTAFPRGGRTGPSTASDGLLQEAAALATSGEAQLSDPFASGSTPAPPEPLLRYYLLLIAADKWLAARQDRPANADFIEFRKNGIAAGSWATPIDLVSGRKRLCDAIAAAYMHSVPTKQLARLGRFLLVSDSLDDTILKGTALLAEGSEVLWSYLHRRPIILPPGYDLTVEKPITLIRPPKVSDFFVVRQEWMCYQAGEVASIANVLAHASYGHREKTTKESITTTTKITDQTTSTEQSQQDTTQTELSTEIERASSIQAHIEGGISVSGDWGLTKYTASAEAGLSASLQESVRQASKVSRETISRAVSKVESHVRQERSDQIRTRTENSSRYSLNNSASSEHLNGIYRWVDRVDRYQVFRFPDRLLLEFEFPEPAEHLQYQLSKPADVPPWATPKPPDFDVRADRLNETNYSAKVALYRASNVPAPPEAEISLTRAFAEDAKATAGAGPSGGAFDPPIVSKTADVTIPSGYLATSVHVSGTAMPFRAQWRMEYDSTSGVDGQQWVEGFHHITFSAFAGGVQIVRDQGGFVVQEPGPGVPPYPVRIPGSTVQFQTAVDAVHHLGIGVIKGDNRSTVEYQQAQLLIPRDAQDVVPALKMNPPVKDTITVGFLVAGAQQAAATFQITCKRSDSAFAEWQQSAYDALYASWAGWDQAWRNGQLPGDPSVPSGPWDSTSPARNKQLIQEELKRQVISWLLGNPDFTGLDAMAPVSADGWSRYDPARTQETAPTILFLEQAFDWGNLLYVCYPYFWARASKWDDLEKINSADPVLTEFLRAGSARVVVSARPGFEDAVNYWLLYGEPFLGGPLPIPGDPMYVAIANEIRDLTDKLGDGEPQESWESKMATPLLWLDPGPDLPKNAANQLGAAPNQPAHPICT
jgi:hypothetical protein